VVERELVGAMLDWACVPSKACCVGHRRRRRPPRRGGREAVAGRSTRPGLRRRDRYVTDWDDTGQADWVRYRRDPDPRTRRWPVHAECRTTPSGEEVELTRPARGCHLHREPPRAARPTRHGRGATVDHREATDSSEVPHRLAVVGAGGVGVEMDGLARIGLEGDLLPENLSCCPGWSLSSGSSWGADSRRGVDVRLGVSVRELRRPYTYLPVVLTLDDDTELVVDEILFATGRARSPTISAWRQWTDSAQLARRRRHLPSAGRRGRWLYAIGDVNHRALLTHQGKYQARIAGAAIAARRPEAVGHRAVGTHADHRRPSRCAAGFSPTPKPPPSG